MHTFRHTQLLLPVTHLTNSHAQTHVHTQTAPLQQQQGKQTSFLTPSAALTLTLDANRCVSQSHRIQSIKHKSGTSLVSDTEQQWAVHTTLYLQFFFLPSA